MAHPIDIIATVPGYKKKAAKTITQKSRQKTTNRNMSARNNVSGIENLRMENFIAPKLEDEIWWMYRDGDP